MSKRNRLAFLPGALALFAFVLTLCLSDVAIEYMKKGLKLCAATVIPSLFPFMVISELLVSGGAGQRLGGLLARPAKFLFGIGSESACACILGALCGFPIGARTLAAYYDRGRISAAEFTRALTFCNIPGSAFVISAVGVSLFGSQEIGILLYVCLILAALCVGVIGRLFFKPVQVEEKSPMAHATVRPQGGISCFTHAIQNAALSMLTVCAYVAFFSSLIGCVGAMLARFGVDEGVTAMLLGFFELSGGVAAASTAYEGQLAVVLCGMILGWSGLSVHFQILTVSGGRPISFKPYFFAKAAQSILCGLFSFAAMKLFPFWADVWADKESLPAAVLPSAGFVCVIFFLATVLPLLLCRLPTARKIGCLKEGKSGHTDH